MSYSLRVKRLSVCRYPILDLYEQVTGEARGSLLGESSRIA